MQANKIRGLILDQIVAFQNGHLASAFSMVEILLALYHGILRHDPQQPEWEDRDRLILSKGHGCSALYAVLADCGYFPLHFLTDSQNGNILGGHPDRKKVPGIEVATGSLGHGLAIGIGMALAAKKARKEYRVYCILGDGELQEGSVWEAALFAGYHKLTNLTVVIDYNRHQSSGAVADILSIEPLAEKWKAFGWQVNTVDGHSIEELQLRFKAIPYSPRPQCCIAYTQKGKGVSFVEGDAAFHTGIPNAEQIQQAKKELGLL